MKLRYYSEFKNIKNKVYRLEIHTTFATFSESLTLSPDCIIVEYESNALFQSLKLSNATISILTKNILSDLYTGENQGVQVRLFNKTDNILEWFGFLTPNIYSSEYESAFDNLNLEAIDTLSCLDGVKYSYIKEDSEFRSFTEVLHFILDKADPNKLLNKVYVQKTNKISKDSLKCLFDESFIHERNFFDEENEPSTCMDVLESLVRYYGMTAIQWKDAYYIIDYDFINKGIYDFFVYDRTTCLYEEIVISNKVRKVLDIGIAESAGSISLGDVYNKVSVVANMNAISVMCPDLLDDDDLINQNSDENKYYETKKILNGEEYIFLNAYFKSKKNWSYLFPFTIKPISNVSIRPISYERINVEEVVADTSIYAGVLWQKCCKYKTGEEPSKISWDTYLTLVNSDNQWDGTDYTVNECFLRLNKEVSPPNILDGGFLIININYVLSGDYWYNPNNDSFSSNFRGGYNILFPVKLKIGDMYFDGDKFIDNSVYEKKVAKGYYHVISYEDFYGGKRPIYKIRDNDGDWFYVDDVKFASHGGEKIQSETLDPNYRWFFKDENKKIYVDESYYHECILQNGFYLVTKNKDNDPVYSDKVLTNTVSWKMNISDSSDGVAIPLPACVITGKLEFELARPNCLGKNIPVYTQEGALYQGLIRAMHISDLSIKYSSKKASYDVFNTKKDDADIVYCNKINDNNITEMEDIELTINSRAKDITSYSNCATKIDSNFAYIKEVYNPIEKACFVPEQIFVDKLYRHYCSPKFRYQNKLNKDVDILSRIIENSLKKEMVVDCMNIDYANESCNVSLVEV